MTSTLARTVYHLHAIGWLHKDIRPHNVVFFGKETWTNRRPYLTGFDYTRQQENDLSERTDPAFDLYRHPRCRGCS